MRITIDHNGHLLLERAGEMKPQYCPYTDGEIDGCAATRNCGDWCPMFREPEALDWECENAPDLAIKLCRIFLHGMRENFTDGRGGATSGE